MLMKNRGRVDRSFIEGDLVLLSTRKLTLKRPHSSKKFCPLFVGPFKVLERVGRSAYRLELPDACKMHPVLHVSKLWKYHADPARPHSVPEPVLLENAEHFEVQDILAVRGKQESRHYLVQWKGQDCMYSTWEPEKNLSMCSELLEQFRSRRQHRAPDAFCYLLTALPDVARPPPPEAAPYCVHLLSAPYGDSCGNPEAVDLM